MIEINQPIACNGEDPELFFPAGEERRAPNRYQQIEINAAKAICNFCVDRLECLEGALERNERFGVWGGLTTYERGVVISKRNAARSRAS